MTLSTHSRHYLLVAVLMAVGCGGAEYEARLERSRGLYDYLQQLDGGLSSPAWNRADVGLAMRLPKPFLQPLPAPAPVKDEEGNILPITDDPRQPLVLGVELPGLVEAFQASLGGADEPEARLYICTNHQRFIDLGPSTVKPDEFLLDLEAALQTGFGVFLSPAESQVPGDNVKYRVLAPGRASNHAQYTTPKDFTAIRFVPNEPPGGSDIEAMLYEHRSGPIQIGILCLFPRNAGASFRERLEMSLETLVASSEAPKPRSGSAGSPGGGGRNAGF